MMVAAATQESEKVAAPVRYPETQHVAVEFHDSLHVRALVGDVAELQRHDAVERVVLWRKCEIGKNLDYGSFGILESDSLADSGRDVAALFAPDVGLLQPRGDFAKIASQRDLERQPWRCDGTAALENDRFQSGFGSED